MPGAPPQQQQSGDNSMAPVWITALLFITLFFVWHAGHTYIVSFVFFLNLLQIKLITLVASAPVLTSEAYIMQTIDPSVVDWDQLILLTSAVGQYTRYPIMGVLGILALVLYKSDVTLKFRKVYDMQTLRAQEQHNWPAIMPVVKEDLVSMDINIGPWAMAVTPMEFARKHNLLKKNDMLMDNPEPGIEMTAGIKRGEAKRVFTLQLGPVWDNFDRCSTHVRAMAAVCMARMNRDKTAANKILSILDKTCSDGKPDYQFVQSVIEKYKNNQNVQEIVNKHAYVLTVLPSLLIAARDDGVVPSSEFLWLKLIDRRLWYMLNCVGRQTPFVEVGGPFAHWKAENALGRRSMAPMIDEAINALEIAVREVKLTPKELGALQS